nr:hypothetical protein SYMBAF_180043 [Serratia symbiotica]
MHQRSTHICKKRGNKYGTEWKEAECNAKIQHEASGLLREMDTDTVAQQIEMLPEKTVGKAPDPRRIGRQTAGRIYLANGAQYRRNSALSGENGSC